jgi:hypothetical protein
MNKKNNKRLFWTQRAIGHLVVIDPVLPIEGEVVVAGTEHDPAACCRGGQPVFFSLQFKTFLPDFLTAEFFCSLIYCNRLAL